MTLRSQEQEHVREIAKSRNQEKGCFAKWLLTRNRERFIIELSRKVQFREVANMLVVTVVNQKGGAGKTPTAVHLAFALAKTGKVLFVDLDPQATASYHFLGKLYREQEPTIYTALTTFKPIPPIIVNERLHLLSAHISLEQAEVSLPH